MISLNSNSTNSKIIKIFKQYKHNSFTKLILIVQAKLGCLHRVTTFIGGKLTIFKEKVCQLSMCQRVYATRMAKRTNQLQMALTDARLIGDGSPISKSKFYNIKTAGKFEYFWRENSNKFGGKF